MRTILFGADAPALKPIVARFESLELVKDDADVVVCFGGDGTLLSAELTWPGVPKVPIRNSRQGLRCMPHPPEQVLKRLAHGDLYRSEYTKLQCTIRHADADVATATVSAMNEINVHMGRINVAVRYKLWVDDVAYDEGEEIIGDGFLVSTPFGSTAYFKQVARGVLYTGFGIAFKLTPKVVNHLVVPETSTMRALITRGPAICAYDSSAEYFDLQEGDELLLKKDPQSATLLTWDEMKHPRDAF